MPIDAVTAGVAITAPIGSPEASPFAKVSTSGTTPTASAVVNAPQRPTPHCTSSKMSAAPRASQTRRAARRKSALRSRAPERPCTGSRMTAATLSSTAASSAAHVVRRHLAGERNAAPRRRLLVAGAVGAGERADRPAVPSAGHRDDRLPAGRLAGPDAARSRSPPRRSCRRRPAPAGRDRAPPAAPPAAPAADAARRSSRRAAPRPARRSRAPRRDGSGRSRRPRGRRRRRATRCPSSSTSQEPWPRTGRIGNWA